MTLEELLQRADVLIRHVQSKTSGPWTVRAGRSAYLMIRGGSAVVTEDSGRLVLFTAKGRVYVEQDRSLYREAMAMGPKGSPLPAKPTGV